MLWSGNVAAAANLLLDETNPLANGGITTGIQVSHEQLVLNAAGQQIAVAGSLVTAPYTHILPLVAQPSWIFTNTAQFSGTISENKLELAEVGPASRPGPVSPFPFFQVVSTE